MMSESTAAPQPKETKLSDSPSHPNTGNGRLHKAVFFELPREIRDMVYASLICLSRPKDCLLLFTTCSKVVRHTLGTSQLSHGRILCRQFDDELHEVLHGPRFPTGLYLNIGFKYSDHLVDDLMTGMEEITAWEEEVPFKGVPKRYLERVERVEMEWMSGGTWYELEYLRYDRLFQGAKALKEMKLRIEVPNADELDCLDEEIPEIVEGWDVLKRLECVHKWEHGNDALINSRPGKEERLMRLVFEKKESEWATPVKEFGRI